MDFECVVIGGGPAGLTAATYLGRFRRKVLVVDAGDSRARYIPKSHNYPGFSDGISGPDLLALQREQARRYGAEIVTGTVTELLKMDGGFSAVFGGSKINASRVVIATGLKDISPDMPGLRKAVADAFVRFCPVCDAYEATDRDIAVYGSIAHAEGKARFLRTYSRKVTLLPCDGESDDESLQRLGQAGVALAPSPPVDFRVLDNGISAELRTGERLRFDVLYPVLGCHVRSDLAIVLGARSNAERCLEVDSKQKTSVDGIYAAGDVVSDLHQLSVAAGHAGVAATAVHNSLPENFR